MGIEVTDRAVELTEELLAAKRPALALQARREHRQLLADSGRRRRLAMRARDHRDTAPPPRHPAQGGNDRIQRRSKLTLAELLKDERVGEVVDVLRGAGEMDHPGRDLYTCRLDALAEKIFERLDVVIGRAVQLLDAACIGEHEVAVQRAQTGRRAGF